MISSEEKINDLRGIISEQENKSNFYNVMLKKLMNTMNHGKVNLNKLFQQMETFNKINELQKEKEIYKNQVNELNDNISELKEELEDVKNNKIENDNEIISNVMNNLENIIRNTSDSNTKNELFKIYKYMNDNNNDINFDKISNKNCNQNPSNSFRRPKKNPIIEDPKSSTSSSKEIMDITSILKEKNQNKSKYKNSKEFIN